MWVLLISQQVTRKKRKRYLKGRWDEVGDCQTQTEVGRKQSFRESPSVKIPTNYGNYFISSNLILFKEKPSEN